MENGTGAQYLAGGLETPTPPTASGGGAPCAPSGKEPRIPSRRQVLLEEWKDIRATLRYFGNKRFAQLTIFMAASGFMFKALVDRRQAFTGGREYVLMSCGILLAMSFFVMELRFFQYWKFFADRGREIEEGVGDLELMRHYRPSSLFNGQFWKSLVNPNLKLVPGDSKAQSKTSEEKASCWLWALLKLVFLTGTGLTCLIYFGVAALWVVVTVWHHFF